MAKFMAEEYTKQLEISSSCDTCKKVPLPKLGKDSRYLFISYSHKDYKLVYKDLAHLYEGNVPFWYDEGLPAGKNWDDVVRERMTDPRCAGIIFYLSENLFLSRSIQTEIQIACGTDGDPSVPGIKRNYFCVNLTSMQPSKILRTVFPHKEFKDSEDEMTEQNLWFNTLATAFPDKATYLTFHNPHHKVNLVQQISGNFGINPNYNPFDFGGAKFRSGNAVIEFENGAVYDGAFQNGLFEGHGAISYSDGAVYDGLWTRGKRQGYGTYTYTDGAVYMGEWFDGKRTGQGLMTFSDGSVYKGDRKSVV